MDEIIFHSKFIDVKHLKDSKTFYFKWCDDQSPMTIDDYREPFISAMKYQKETDEKAENFLSDITDQQTVSPSYQKWLQHEILAKASEVGIQRIGIILTANAFKRFYINRVIKFITKVDIPIKTFRHFNDAMNWFNILSTSKQKTYDKAY